MDTSDLIKRIWIDRKKRVGEVPFRFETIFQDDIVIIAVWIVLSNPLITIAGYYTGLIIYSILFTKSFPHFSGAVKQLYFIIIEAIISGFSDFKKIIEEVEITITAITPELRN